MIPAILAIPSKDGQKIRVWWLDQESAQRGKEAAGIAAPTTAYYPAGRDNLMVTAAVRYCLGRRVPAVIEEPMVGIGDQVQCKLLADDHDAVGAPNWAGDSGLWSASQIIID